MDPLRSQIHIRCNTFYGLLLVAVPFCNPVGAHSPPSVGLADARDSTLSLVRPTRSSNSFLVISVMLFFLTGSVRPLVVPPRSYPTSRSCEKRRRSLRSSSLPPHSPLTPLVVFDSPPLILRLPTLRRIFLGPSGKPSAFSLSPISKLMRHSSRRKLLLALDSHLRYCRTVRLESLDGRGGRLENV